MLAQSALQIGLDALTEAQKKVILDDPLLLSRLHFDVWASQHAPPGWRERLERMGPCFHVSQRSNLRAFESVSNNH
jgi:membrane glycosyltransferase